MVFVIIPIYNVAQYLPECIESVIAQTYKDIEIILVDDGSTDNSGIICDQYAKKDNRIKVIHKPNGGLSSRSGVGNSNFRTSDKSDYTDTVPFGAFKREVFDKIGVFDVDLPRSEDNDFNSRIRKNGGKVYMACDIKFKYYCRDTVLGLLGQAIKNGNALFLTIRKNPSAMSLRHYIPFCSYCHLLFCLLFLLLIFLNGYSLLK